MAFDFSALNSACKTTFAQTVTHAPQLGAPQEMQAIVESGRHVSELTPGVLVVASAPTVDFVTPPGKNDRIIIGSASYRVFEMSTDEADMIHLSLTL